MPAHDGLEFVPSDLAPGDAKALDLDRHGLTVTRVTSGEHPLFAVAYERLWKEFGPRGEMESAGVIRQRLTWHPGAPIGSCWLSYALIVVQHRGQLVAVRDHTAIVRPEGSPARGVVHLSHVLVEQPWRRTGLAGWLRAWPLQTVRGCLRAAGLPPATPISLVAEMEHPDPSEPMRLTRLLAYEKAGFKKVASVQYLQPDFRTPQEIDASGGARPLPFGLILRRVGQEHEDLLGGAELRAIVRSLYHMYEAAFRPQDMEPLWRRWNDFPAEEESVRLVPPST